jgi:hypothetical protein
MQVVCSLINVILVFFGEVGQVVLLNMHSFSVSKKMDKSNVSGFFMCLHLNHWV